MHAVDDNRRFEQIGSVFGENLADTWLPDPVPRPPDALHPRRNRTRRCDLNDEVDRTHIDAEFER